MKKRILLISYNFPPYPGIGGRRWAKFAKYLKQSGDELHVICSENPFSVDSEWTADVKGLNVVQLPLKYPSALITYPKGFFGRVRYRMSLALVRLVTNKNYYDRALFWEKQIIKKSTQIIVDNKIDNVIVTGAPFHLLFYISKLKRMFPTINLIVDFRDYWTEDNSLFHFGSLSDKCIEEEKKMESFVLNTADKITTVAKVMTDHFNQVTKTKKCFTLLNGYDPDDFEFLRGKTKKKNEKITFVFTGNLYKNIENIFIPFCEAIAFIKANHKDLYDRVVFDFFGSQPPNYKTIVEDKKLDCIRFHEQISLNETLEHIFHADYCMLFLNDIYSFSLSTKFCEYLGLKKRVVLFSKKGFSSDYIVSNNIGVWVNPDSCLTDLLSVINEHENDTGNLYNPEFDPEQFSVKNIAKQIDDLLI